MSTSQTRAIPSSALLASLDVSSRRAFLRANTSLALRERLSDALEGTVPEPPAKKSRSEREAGVDSAHAWTLVPVGDDSTVDRKALRAVLATARKPPFADPSGLRAQQIDALCAEEWASDFAPKQARARNDWEEDVIAGLGAALKHGKWALSK